jgi:uncharacterized protein
MAFVNDISKTEILNTLDEIAKRNSKKVSKKDTYFLFQIRDSVERQVISAIRERQKSLKKLKTDEFGRVAVWGGDLTPGCQICLNGTSGSTPLRGVYECNLNCDFCYYYGSFDQQVILKSDHFAFGNRFLSSQDLMLWVKRNLDKVKGVMWVAMEPFMEIEKHYDVIEFLSRLGIHQHMYTNGTLVKKPHLEQLQQLGLDELRFNLAATNCSNKVIETMALARDYFPYLVVESPMYPDFFNSFMEKRKKILATQFDHLNINELHLNYNIYNFFEGPKYQYHDGYVSPINSRQLTYDLMKVAEKEDWPVVIHDCSNETKFYRGVRSDLDRGLFDYKTEMTLPINWYRKAVEQYDLGV